MLLWRFVPRVYVIGVDGVAGVWPQRRNETSLPRRHRRDASSSREPHDGRRLQGRRFRAFSNQCEARPGSRATPRPSAKRMPSENWAFADPFEAACWNHSTAFDGSLDNPRPSSKLMA